MARIPQVDLASVVRKVRQYNTEIDKPCEDAGAQPADRCRRDLGQVDGPDDSGLADAEAGDEAAGVDGAQVAVGAHEDGDADDPEGAEQAGGPDTADAVADEEGTGHRQFDPLQGHTV